ncbi:hypothetical protein ACT3OH_16025 [Vreelandella zhanjiangensis]|uniref:hypothetical protein n=1 Tax=Vreelandella zhanjiangensis TaxID=1121960 RepID=UPI00402AFDC3
MPNKMEVIGKRAGMLEVIERLPGYKLLCRCDCGGERVVRIGHFNSGSCKSCGCHVARHGHTAQGRQSKEYVSYRNMMKRCHDPGNKRYSDYGGKGIVVCARWQESFEHFLEDMGKCPPGMQIDRRDNRLGYSPDNCRWATPKKNMANRSCTRVWVINGKEYLSAADAATDQGVNQSTIRARCLGRMAGGKWYEPKPGYSWRWRYSDEAS